MKKSLYFQEVTYETNKDFIFVSQQRKSSNCAILPLFPNSFAMLIVKFTLKCATEVERLSVYIMNITEVC